MEKSSTAFIGMDVHKESIDVGIADAKEARHYGRVGGDAASVDRVVRGRPTTRTSPASGRRIPAIMEMVVVLPEPFGPSRP